MQFLATFCALLVTFANPAFAQEFRDYYVTDVVGSPVVATDTNTNTVWTEDYLPYGQKRTLSASSSNGGDNERAFAGAVQNELSGLVDLGNRSYDPIAGRFLSIDPVGVSLGDGGNFNRYCYANNNPHKYVDPDGRLAWFIPIIIGIGWLTASDAANAPGHGDVPIPRGDAARSGLMALAPIPGSGLVPSPVRQVVVQEAKREVATTVATTTGSQVALLAAPKMVKHHIFNVFRGNSAGSQKYRDFFQKHGIDLDKHTVQVSEAVHKKLHEAGNNWTTKWKTWIDANPNATTKEVYQQAGRMMDDAGIGHLPIVPYK
jgi:RHS repeat-associated protein